MCWNSPCLLLILGLEDRLAALLLLSFSLYPCPFSFLAFCLHAFLPFLCLLLPFTCIFFFTFSFQFCLFAFYTHSFLPFAFAFYTRLPLFLFTLSLRSWACNPNFPCYPSNIPFHIPVWRQAGAWPHLSFLSALPPSMLYLSARQCLERRQGLPTSLREGRHGWVIEQMYMGILCC